MKGLDWRGQRPTTWLEQLMAFNPPINGLGVDWQPRYRAFPGSSLQNGNAFFYRFLYERANTSAIKPPVPLPESDVVFACSDGQANMLLTYDLQTSQWREIYQADQLAHLEVATLPGQSRLWLEQLSLGNVQENRNLIWQDGRVTSLQPPFYTYWNQTDPSGTRILVSQRDEQVNFYYLNVAECSLGSCQSELLTGRILWSPNGRFRLVENRMNNVTEVQNSAGQVLFTLRSALGQSAWLDEKTVLWAEPGERGLFLYRAIDDSKATAWLTMAQIIPLLPEHIARDYRVAGFVQSPDRPSQWFINILVDAVVDFHYVVAYDFATGQLRFLEELGRAELDNSAKNGSYLTEISYLKTDERTRLLVYDPIFNAKYTYPVHSSANSYPSHTWHKDGEWLLLFGAGHARLIAPAHNYVLPIFPELTQCSSAAWLD